jgi:hypothetical protein
MRSHQTHAYFVPRPTVLGLAALLLGLLSRPAAADYLQVQFSTQTCGATAPVQAAVGTLSLSMPTCTTQPGSVLNASAKADYNNLRASTHVTGSGGGGLVQAFVISRQGDLIFNNLPAGAVVQAIVTLNGTYDFNNANSVVRIDPQVEIALNGTVDLLQDPNIFCASSGSPCTDTSGSGSISAQYLAPLSPKSGFNDLLFEFNLSLSVAGNGATGDANFGDPGLAGFNITDPNTGQPISGVTVTGANGFMYPVDPNTGTVPEPSSLVLLGTCVVGALGLSRARMRRTRVP